MSARFVIVHRSYDPLQVEILGDILRQSGIAARVLGTRSAALIGVAPNVMQMHIEVPASQAGAATDFLEAYFAGDGEELLRQEGVLGGDPDAGDEGEPASAAPARPEPAGAELRRPLLAAGSVMLIFGLGHLYARRPWTALALAGAQIWALAAVASAGSWPELATGGTAFVAILFFDLIGSQLACRAENRGLHRSAGAQLALGAAFVAAAVALSGLLGPRIPPPKQESPVQLVPAGPRMLYD